MIRHSRPTIGLEEIEAVSKVLSSGDLAQGEVVREFERELSGFIGVRYGLATGSGTSSLHLALLALGVREGEEVIIPSYVCSAVLDAVNYTGARACVVDVDPDNFNIDIASTRGKVNRRTRAIIIPHMFGAPADIGEFLKLEVPIIEDCAQALGAEYSGRKVGSFGQISIFSFYATKVITTGQGGMALTNSLRLYNRMKDLREFDERPNYIRRFNYKMTDFQAAMGLSQLRKLPAFLARRRTIADFYNNRLSGCGLKTPSRRGSGHIFYRYLVGTRGKAREFLKYLNKEGIEAKPPIYKPIHRYLGLEGSEFINTERAMRSLVSLPIYPSLKDSEAKRVVDVVKRIANRVFRK